MSHTKARPNRQGYKTGDRKESTSWKIYNWRVPFYPQNPLYCQAMFICIWPKKKISKRRTKILFRVFSVVFTSNILFQLWNQSDGISRVKIPCLWAFLVSGSVSLREYTWSCLIAIASCVSAPLLQNWVLQHGSVSLPTLACACNYQHTLVHMLSPSWLIVKTLEGFLGQNVDHE